MTRPVWRFTRNSLKAQTAELMLVALLILGENIHPSAVFADRVLQSLRDREIEDQQYIAETLKYDEFPCFLPRFVFMFMSVALTLVKLWIRPCRCNFSRPRYDWEVKETAFIIIRAGGMAWSFPLPGQWLETMGRYVFGSRPRKGVRRNFSNKKYDVSCGRNANW